MTTPQHERAPSDVPASTGDPPRSEALEAELAALEAILPAGDAANGSRALDAARDHPRAAARTGPMPPRPGPARQA